MNQSKRPPVFKTIRQVAAMGILPEHRLREMHREGTLPGIQTGQWFRVNVSALEDMLNSMSLKSMKG